MKKRYPIPWLTGENRPVSTLKNCRYPEVTANHYVGERGDQPSGKISPDHCPAIGVPKHSLA